MNKNETLAKIKTLGLLAVIRGQTEEMAIEMVQALVAGGVTGIEITYSTPNAEKVVQRLDQMFGNEILLGMGTLTELAQVKSAKAAGAAFLVSPICESNLVKEMVGSGLVVMAGALTPTEVFQAYKLGSDIVKVFPGSLAGPGYIKSLKGPFPHIPLMPTGGVNINNVKEWFAAGVVAVGAGSELCPANLVREKRFAEITQMAADFVAAMAEARAGLK